jgi:protein O-GlcNAc transferase
MAMQLAQASRGAEAIGILRSLLADAPGFIPARCVLAMLLQESGERQAALTEIEQAAALAPDDATTQEIRASVLLGLNRAAEAEIAARIALAGHPHGSRAWEYLWRALDAQGRVAETIEALKSSLALQPDSALARQVLVRRLLQARSTAAALDVALHRSVLNDHAMAQAMAADFIAVGAQQDAIEFLQAVVRHHPRNYAALMLLARTLHGLARSSEALSWSERARESHPHAIEPMEMSAVTLIDRGDVAAGLVRLRSLLSHPDARAETRNRHLILSHYDLDATNAVLFDLHVDWVRRYIQPFGEPHLRKHPVDPARPLRVGWLSPRFGEGPVASFFTETLRALVRQGPDRKDFQHILIALGAGSDPATRQLRELADAWVPMRDLDDASLLTRLRDLDLDVAIDLAGHSVGNRLSVLAQRI